MHPNEATLRRIDEAQTEGDLDAFLAEYTDDVIIHIGGSNTFTGTYKGKDQLSELFQRFMAAIGDYTFEPHAYLADDEHGVAMQRSKAVRGSQMLETRDTFVCHFRDGKVSELWFLTDDQAGFDAWVGK